MRVARTTLPALMQLVHAFTRLGVPLTTARTRWMFGSHRRLILLWENVTDLPNHGFLPQMSHTAAIARRRYQTPSHLPVPYAAMFRKFASRSVLEISPLTLRTTLPVASMKTVPGWPMMPSESRIAPGGSNTLG